MKNIIMTSIFLLSSLGVIAQTTENDTHTRQLEQLSENLYSVVFTNAEGKVVQSGRYWLSDGEFVPHGIWTLYCNASGNVFTRVKFDKGTKLWVETTIDGKKVVYNKTKLAIKDIKEEIRLLEEKLAALEKAGT